MTTSKFHELLDGPSYVPTKSDSRPSSSYRFPIDLGPPPMIPSRHSSRSSQSPSKKLQRKNSGSRPTPAATPSPFSGPDADFDFGKRERPQRLESESPMSSESSQPQTKQEEDRQQRSSQEGSRGAVRRRLRKLSLTGR